MNIKKLFFYSILSVIAYCLFEKIFSIFAYSTKIHPPIILVEASIIFSLKNFCEAR